MHNVGSHIFIQLLIYEPVKGLLSVRFKWIGGGGGSVKFDKSGQLSLDLFQTDHM